MAFAFKGETSAARLVKTIRAFAQHNGGATAVIFAIAAPVLAVMSLAAVDYSRGSSAKQNLQDALDTATLAVARSTLTDQTAMNTMGANVLTSQINANGDMQLASNTFTVANNIVSGQATATYKAILPLMANASGYNTVAASSQVMRSINHVEVAMVLDNTGSMAQSGKMTNLKVAANHFVDILAAASARSLQYDPTSLNPVKIGLVPFGTTVRLGNGFKKVADASNATWMTMSYMDLNAVSSVHGQIFNDASGKAVSPTPNRFSLLTAMGQPWAGCIESRPQPYDVSDVGPDPRYPDTYFVPYFWPDEPDSSSKSSKQNGSWTVSNDYLTDKVYSKTNYLVPQGNPGKYTTAPSGGTGPNKNCTIAPISRLTTDWTALHNSINAMTPVGETHIPIGMVWGWHLLSPNAPFADGAPYKDANGAATTTKIAILMTDGENTFSNSYNNVNGSDYDGYGYIWQNRLGTKSLSNAPATIDSRLTLLCSNMRNAGIRIYTIGVMVTTASKQLLTTCAGPTGQYYDVTASSQIDSVFTSIANEINNLRISK